LPDVIEVIHIKEEPRPKISTPSKPSPPKYKVVIDLTGDKEVARVSNNDSYDIDKVIFQFSKQLKL